MILDVLTQPEKNCARMGFAKSCVGLGPPDLRPDQRARISRVGGRLSIASDPRQHPRVQPRTAVHSQLQPTVRSFLLFLFPLA
jgi:hypothetical protein